MVNKLHCLVDIILIVFFLGLPCVPSPSLLLFVLFEFHPRHSYQKMRRWVCITRQFFLRFFNFLPDLPTTSFFTPQYPILFFFHFGFYFFLFVSSTLLQISNKLTKIDLFCLCLGNYFLFEFFFTQKVPIFCEDCRPELTEAYHNPKDGDLDTEPLKRIYQISGNP